MFSSFGRNRNQKMTIVSAPKPKFGRSHIASYIRSYTNISIFYTYIAMTLYSTFLKFRQHKKQQYFSWSDDSDVS